MKMYLKSIAQQLRNHSLSLEKSNILIDKPWALIDDEFEMQKLIFKKNKDLVLSKNGQVQMGKWDYFPEAKSLLIDRSTDKILCNEAFVDNGVMILKLDGTNNRFFILANENLVPDLDAERYLKELRYTKLNIITKEVKNGKTLEIHRRNADMPPERGDYVTIDALPMDDGKYELKNETQYFEIAKGRIIKILSEKKYINPDGVELIIQKQNRFSITYGDYVYISGMPAKTGIINFSFGKNLVVRDGMIIRTEYKNLILRHMSMFVNEYF